jgi:hypothetical protein
MSIVVLAVFYVWGPWSLSRRATPQISLALMRIYLRNLRPFRTYAWELAQRKVLVKHKKGGSQAGGAHVESSTVAIALNLNIVNDYSRSIMEEADPMPPTDGAEHGEALESEETIQYLQGWKLWLLIAG